MYFRNLLICFYVAVLLSSLFSKDVYVSSGKNGNGSKQSPYNDISDAINMGIYAGDVIHVSEGIYYGEGGSGKWVIKVNNITIAGGYNKTFTERNPWKYQSILIRGMGDGALEEAKKREHGKKWGLDLTFTKASYNPDAMVTDAGNADGTIIDGFIIDGYTRNSYKSNGDLKLDIGPIGTPLVSFKSKGVKIRNSVVINSAGPGIRLIACGKKDDQNFWPEISNCIIVNTLMEAIDFRVGTWDSNNDPDGGYALIQNNSIAFVWSNLGEGYGVLIGRQTKLNIENNIFAFATDYAMNNGFGNDKAKLINNVFFNNRGGVYRYFAKEGSGSTVVVDDPTLLTGKQANKMYYLSDKSKDNVSSDPKFKVDPDFFDKFSNQIQSEGGGKIVWDDVNKWRSALGLSLIGSSGSGRKNFAPIYEHEYMFLFSDSVNVGAKKDFQFQTYASKEESKVEKEYTDTKLDNIKKSPKDYYSKNVKISAKIGEKNPTSFYLDGITKDNYICFKLKTIR
ncbi:MAG TPA: right-handed parallel beta-helix repeat-containing protein [Spirochaetota bacterium]|nr:right-handed parallel beta-helix repeat-containing protein [Spirochaetota bacterium]